MHVRYCKSKGETEKGKLAQEAKKTGGAKKHYLYQMYSTRQITVNRRIRTVRDVTKLDTFFFVGRSPYTTTAPLLSFK